MVLVKEVRMLCSGWWTKVSKQYRVQIEPEPPHGCGVMYVGFGDGSGKSAKSWRFSRPDRMPDWMQERVAVLRLLDVSKERQSIKGVGRRVTLNVFWIDVPEGEELETS